MLNLLPCLTLSRPPAGNGLAWMKCSTAPEGVDLWIWLALDSDDAPCHGRLGRHFTLHRIRSRS